MLDIQAQIARLEAAGVRYAFYYQYRDQEPLHLANCLRFHSASLIKVPILLAWLELERRGEVSREELCDLDSEPPVQGAGLSWLLRARQLPYHDLLLLMIALSDNLSTNLVIRRVGLEKLNRLIQDDLGLEDCRLERKLFDYEARARGLDNWISASDCLRFYELIARLPAADRAWTESLLEVNHDDALLKRCIPRDTLTFYHKTGSIPGLLHDWGYTRDRKIFLLTQGVTDELAVFEVLGELGRLLAEQ